MPRVTPSQVVALIDQLFPQAKASPDFPVYSGSAPLLSAIVELSGAIPEELLTISGEEYTNFVCALAALRNSVQRWTHRGGDDPPAAIKGVNPIVLVRRALARCPDQSPTPATAALSFISDVPLRNSIRLDISTAGSALHNGEWKGATVLAGAAVEALLLWAVQNHSGLAALPTKPRGDPHEWGLAKLIGVGIDLNLIQSNTADQARLAKNFRNLIHPGRAQRTGEMCDRGTALSALAAVELVVRDLSLPNGA